MRILEVSETVDDLLNGRVGDDVLDGEDIDLGERVEVAADGGVPAGAGLDLVAEKMSALLVEALVKGGPESSSRVVNGAWDCQPVTHEVWRQILTEELGRW